MAEPGIILSNGSSAISAMDRAEKRRLNETARRKFNSYDTSKWERTYFNPKNGGYLVTEHERIVESVKSRPNANGERQSMNDYLKEYVAAQKYASWGFQIEHLADRKLEGGNPDVRIVRTPNFLVNGEMADIKTVTVPGKVYTRGNEAFEKNGAQKVLLHFTFSRSEDGWGKRIDSLAKDGKHGYYYFEGENRYYEF